MFAYWFRIFVPNSRWLQIPFADCYRVLSDPAYLLSLFPENSLAREYKQAAEKKMFLFDNLEGPFRSKNIFKI